MKVAIQVHPNSDWQSSQYHARQLCDALLQNGNQVVAVLFYGVASHIASRSAQHDWSDWNSKDHPLLVCSTLHQSLAVAEPTDPLFEISGMAKWIQLSEQADQVITIP